MHEGYAKNLALGSAIGNLSALASRSDPSNFSLPKAPKGAISTAWLNSETALWIKATILRESLVKGRLPERSPIVTRLNKIAHSLRQAARKDPLFSQLGVTLPPKAEVTVINSPELRAFIFPERPQEVFISTGLLLVLRHWHYVAPVLAHEQAHAIAHEIKHSSSYKPFSKEVRNGEAIWKDPVLAISLSQSPIDAATALLRKDEEVWCDTHGSHAILNSLGINPLLSSSVLSQIASLKGSDVWAPQPFSVMDALSLTLRTHPPPPYRILTARAVAHDFSYPQTIKAQRVNLNEEERIDLSNLELSNRAEHYADLISDRTNLLEWLARPKLTVPVPKGGGLLFDKGFLGALKRGSEQERVSVCAAILMLNRLEHGCGKWELERAGEYTKRHREKPVNTRTREKLLDTIKRWKEKYGPFSPPAIKQAALSEVYPLFRSHLSAALLGHEDSAEEFIKGAKPEDLLTLSKRIVLPNFDQRDLARAFWRAVDVKTFSYIEVPAKLIESNSQRRQRQFEEGQYIADRRTGDLKSFDIKLKGRDLYEDLISALETQNATEPRRIIRALITECCVKFLKDSHFSSPQAYLKWLHELKEANDLKVTAAGPFTTAEDMFLYALILVSSTKSLKSYCQRIRLIYDQGFHPGVTYLQTKRTDFRAAEELTSVIGSLDQNEQVSAIKELANYYPLLADRVIQDLLLRSGDKDALLKELTEPTDSEDYNLHDKWALVGDSADTLRDELHRRESEEIDSFLKRLADMPHRFSTFVYERLAQNCITELSDLEALVNFIEVHFKVSLVEETPWVEKARVENTVAVVLTGLSSLIKNGAIDFNDPATRERVFKLIAERPRHSMRNKLVSLWVQTLSKQESLPPIELRRLAELVETEPLSDMFRELFSEIKKEGDKICHKVEKLLEVADKIIIPAKYLEGKEDDASYTLIQHSGHNLFVDVKTGRRVIPLDHVTVLDLGLTNSAASKPLASELSFLKGVLPKFATSTVVRYQTFEHLRENSNSPGQPLKTKSSSLLEAEKTGKLLIELLNYSDPLTAKPFEVNASSEHFKAYLRDLFTCQVAPTPLRDQWVIHTLAEFYRCGGLLSTQDLKALASELYLPENIECIGNYIWSAFKQGGGLERLLAGEESLDQIINFVQEIFPFYSETRNRVLLEVRLDLPAHSYEFARKLNLLRWIPGLPLPLPTSVVSMPSTLLDFEARLLETFEDYDVVEFILFGFGVIKDKPWATGYMEYLLGGTLDELHEANSQLSPSTRRIFLHRVFGGHKGLFERQDPYALFLLAQCIGDFFGETLADKSLKALVKDLCHDVFYRARLPSQIRTEILGSLADWIAENKLLNLTDEKYGDLIIRIFSAAGPPGIRILQGLLVEPRIFPPALRPFLRQAQDMVGPSNPCLPFHLAQSDGHEVTLGRWRGGGSMAEIHEIKTINGEGFAKPVVGKFLRADVLGNLGYLEEPLGTIADTIAKFGFPWSRKLVSSVLESCAREAKHLEREAELTGRPIAEMISQILGGSVSRIDEGLEIALTWDDKQLLLVIPQSEALAQQEKLSELASEPGLRQHFFVMSDLGQGFKSFALCERERGTETLADFLGKKGGSLRQISEVALNLFLKVFLERDVLLQDLHLGNLGFIEGVTPCKYGLLDFGTARTSFPKYWKGWLLRVSRDVALGDAQQIERDLVEVSLMVAGEQSLTPSRLSQAKAIARELCTAQTLLKKGESGFGVLERVTDLLFDEWPIPPELRDFGEAFRKAAREFGPHISSGFTERLKASLMLHGLSILSSGAPGTTRDSVIERQVSYFISGQALDPANSHEIALNKEQAQWFTGRDKVPKGTKIIYENDDGWQIKELKESTAISSPTFLTKDFFVITPRQMDRGFFQAEEEGVVYYLTFETLKRLGDQL